MTCDHCCGADKLFDKKSALRELSRYEKKGAKGVTRKLLQLFDLESMEGQRLLDIGSGIGVLSWYFLSRKGESVTMVDASSGYQEVARSHAEKLGDSNKVDFKFGDFTDWSNEIQDHDYVALDKVICCYPNYQKLLGSAADKTNKMLFVTMPIGGRISKTLSVIAAAYMKISKNPFRAYVHAPVDVDAFVVSHGFEITHAFTKFPWLVRAYKRI